MKAFFARMLDAPALTWVEVLGVGVLVFAVLRWRHESIVVSILVAAAVAGANGWYFGLPGPRRIAPRREAEDADEPPRA